MGHGNGVNELPN